MYYEMIGFVPDHTTTCLKDVPAFKPADAALILDFDGVLVEIAETPDQIDVPEKLVPLLNSLTQACGGALAIVSGRSNEDLKRHIPGFEGVMVGCHGAEFAGQDISRTIGFDAELATIFADLVEDYARLDPAYHCERKPTGAVLHFRRDPSLRGRAYHFLETITGGTEGFHIHHNAMSFEIRPNGVSNEAALDWLMDEAPFKGRKPVYLGDDITDEVALIHVRDQDGISIKVGEGESEARYRLGSPADVHAYLIWCLNGGAGRGEIS